MKLSGKDVAELVKRLEESKKNRGTIIDKTIQIENFLNQIITSYFFPNEIENEFTKIFLSEMPFRRKIGIFRKLKYHLNPEFGGKYRNIPDELDKLANMRNKAAHEIDKLIISFFKSGKRKIGNPLFDEEYLKKFEKKNKKLLRAIISIWAKSLKSKNG